MVQTFGFHLAELEVRQHSAVHRAALGRGALGCCRRTTGPPTSEAAARDPALLDRLAVDGWPELAARAGRAHPRGARHPAGHGVAPAALGPPSSCGRYVVSFSQSAADLVAVRALARLAVG